MAHSGVVYIDDRAPQRSRARGYLPPSSPTSPSRRVCSSPNPTPHLQILAAPLRWNVVVTVRSRRKRSHSSCLVHWDGRWQSALMMTSCHRQNLLLSAPLVVPLESPRFPPHDPAYATGRCNFPTYTEKNFQQNSDRKLKFPTYSRLRAGKNSIFSFFPRKSELFSFKFFDKKIFRQLYSWFLPFVVNVKGHVHPRILGVV